MHNQEAGRDDVQYFVQVSTNHEFREALARIRMLDRAKAKSPEGRERIAWELAISRYLMVGESPRH
jgi:hypothetical protein